MFDELDKKKNHGRCKICGRVMSTDLHPIGPVCLKKIRNKIKNHPNDKGEVQEENMFDFEEINNEKTSSI